MKAGYSSTICNEFHYVACHCIISCVLNAWHETLHALCIACLCLRMCNRLSVALAAHYGFLGSNSSNRQVPKIVCALYVIQAVLLCLVCYSCSYSHEEIVPAHQETPGLVVVKPCWNDCCSILHSYTHVLGWAYFRIGWAYFRVKGGPIFGRRVLEIRPSPSLSRF